ncbi:MAG: hypothetical protein WD734_06400 [Dehalococcoidia bacterium]
MFLVEAGPFSDQSDLLFFAALLEASPGVRGISLVSAQPANAQFEVQASARDDLVATLTELPGYPATVQDTGDRIRASIRPAAPRAASDDSPAVVPARRRFRVFRAQDAADDASEATSGHTGSVPPWRPAE